MSVCPMCKFEILKCPQCGYATTFFPRHGKRGEGAHYAKRISKLGRGHELALEVLRSQHAEDFQSGLTLSAVWLCAKEICTTKQLHWPTKQGLSGRLSELQGLGYVKSVSNQVRLFDKESQQYRFEHRPRWFIPKSPHQLWAEQTGVYGTE